MSIAMKAGVLTLADLSRQVASIVRQSLSWSESRMYIDATVEPSAQSMALLDRWKRLVTTRTGDPAVFTARLATLGISEQDALTWLTTPKVPDSFVAPEWATALDEILAMHSGEARCLGAVHLCDAALMRESGHVDRPVFFQFTAPFVAYALDKIDDLIGELEVAAREDLALSFARELSWTCARTVAHELKKSSTRGELGGATPEERYLEYINQVLPASRAEFLQRYPVLARLMATITLQCIENTREVVDHLCTDIDSLSHFTGVPLQPRAARIKPFLSDFHNGGRSVWRVVVRSNDTTAVVFHKPRSLKVDEAWASFIEWLSACGHTPVLRSAKAFDCGTYGWSTEAVAADCTSEEEVRMYFRRQGVHTALFTALGGQDFHAENFIAAGAFPIPVDLEGLFAPIITAPSGPLAKIPMTLAPIQCSGAGNLMLPYFRRGEEGKPMYSASAVAGTGEQPWPRKLPRWSGLNTDELHLNFEQQELRFDESLPTLHGKKVSADPYRDEIIGGIRSTWQFLVAHRDELVSPEGPLAPFRGLTSRTLFRDTQQYADLMFWTTAPDILESGTAYDVALETLAGAVPFFCNGMRFPEMIDLEKQSFWRRDVPMAETRNDGVTLQFATGETFSPVLESSAWDQTMHRLAKIDGVNAEWQAAVASSLLHMTRKGRGSVSENLLDAAVAIGHEVAHAVVRFGEDVSWLTFMHAEGSNRVLPLQTQPWDLTGNAGNAIFLAELSRITGDSSFGELAKTALSSAERTWKAMRETEFSAAINVSAFTGSFGLVYALLRAGRALNEECLYQDALRVALSHPVELFQRETNPDWITGVAGTLAVIAQLHAVCPHEILQEQASICREIIDGAAREDGLAGWQVPYFQRPLLGMAHGSSGIAAGLLSAKSILHKPVSTSVLNAFEHERRYFRRDLLRWPNLQHDAPHYMTGWCAGPAGFGMARLLALRSEDAGMQAHRDTVLADLEDALAAANTCAHAADHHACCGDAGTVMFLAMAARQLGREDLAQASRAIAEGVLGYFREHGLWRMQGGFHDRVVMPGLLSGQVSIGMSFLSAIDSSTTEYLALC